MSDSKEVQIDQNDLRVETYRTPRQGGFSTLPDNSVRITHLPTGITVTAEGERTVFKAQATAMKQLEAVLKAHENKEPLKALMLPNGAIGSGFYLTSTAGVGGGGGGGGSHAVVSIGGSGDVCGLAFKDDVHNVAIGNQQESILREKIAKEIEDQIVNSNSALFRSGLKIAAHMVRGEKGQTVKSEVDFDLYVLWVRGDSVDEQPQGKIITKEEAEVVEKLISTAGETIFSLKKYVEVK